MSKTVQQLQNLMVDQLKRRGFYPKEEKEGLIAVKGVIIAKINKAKPNIEIIDIFSGKNE